MNVVVVVAVVGLICRSERSPGPSLSSFFSAESRIGLCLLVAGKLVGTQTHKLITAAAEVEEESTCITRKRGWPFVCVCVNTVKQTFFFFSSVL